eukprot:1147401-Pelagomonas_calceolata.AAC.3
MRCKHVWVNLHNWGKLPGDPAIKAGQAITLTGLDHGPKKVSQAWFNCEQARVRLCMNMQAVEQDAGMADCMDTSNLIKLNR